METPPALGTVRKGGDRVSWAGIDAVSWLQEISALAEEPTCWLPWNYWFSKIMESLLQSGFTVDGIWSNVIIIVYTSVISPSAPQSPIVPILLMTVIWPREKWMTSAEWERYLWVSYLIKGLINKI